MKAIYLLVILLFSFSGTVQSGEKIKPPPPPKGFEWVEIEEIKAIVLKPNDWYVNGLQGGYNCIPHMQR